MNLHSVGGITLNVSMLLAQVVATSEAVAATRSRKTKVAEIALLLGAADAGERQVVAAYVGGSLLQRRTGIGWRGLSDLPQPAEVAALTVAAVDAELTQISELTGEGSQRARAASVAALFAAATEAEQTWLRGAISGSVRQGALDALVQEGLAAAADVPIAVVRRAAMLAGSTVGIAEIAFDGVDALTAIGLEVLRPLRPMLASSAPDVATAVTTLLSAGAAEVWVDTKLDGIRIQVHRDHDRVVIATRSLDVITERLPEVVAVAMSLPATTFVLDGEALANDDAGRPRPFQETASRTAQAAGVMVTPYFFDLLHLNGVDLLDSPGHERQAALAALVPEANRVPYLRTTDPDAAEAFTQSALAAGHEGVVIKALDAPYAAGRRGSAWIKVKPVHTFDLVVLGVEWGSGRRQGWLSNIHLGARGVDGEWVMVGKTFKGMTDEMLRWQTERFQELETSREGHVVWVRPEQVVEIAIDGVQRSTRYPGGVALRFARVVRYRDDKSPAEADTIDSLQALR